MKTVRAAKVVILDEDDNALVLGRSGTHPRSPHHPDLPGGIIEDDETPEHGLSREIEEETGLKIRPDDLRLIHTKNYRFPGKSVTRFVYAIRLHQKSPDVTLSWEHENFSWQSVRELSNLERPYQQAVDIANKRDIWSDIPA